MATALSFLVNDNPAQDVSLLDSFINPRIFEQFLTKNNQQLIDMSTEITIDARYNLRPDLLSYEMYGSNFWYPAILSANKLGSIFQFKAEYLNNRCLIPNPDRLVKMLQEENVELFKRKKKEELKNQKQEIIPR